ncbi:MFS transporter [Paraglaciecola sp.]|uniref:MFS transporter n=1 Tax=Paraglaciecola sp. TaxID=1920173 RepID=UPI0030F49245
MNRHILKKLKVARINTLVRYILAAILVRTSTGGSAVAIILLSRNYGADGSLAGALAACLTAPHVFGPIYGRWLEKVNNAFIVIAMSCFLFTVFFQLAILSIEWQQLWLTFISLLLCGACSSFMMGGLSTQVNHLVEDDVTVRRKAQSWDTLTYGIGLTVGPMLIALLSSVYSTKLAVSAVMYLPVLACLIVFSLPKYHKHHQHIVPNFKQVVKVLWQTPALKKTLLMTSGAAFSMAVLPVVAVYYSETFQQGQEYGAYLVTLYGVGCLCGAASLGFKPLVKDALILLKNVGCILVACLILVYFSSSFMASMFAYWICGVVNSVFFAVTIAARTEYAPVQGAAQIYMWVAAAKITAASLGALVAGLLVDHFITLPVLTSILMLSVTLLVCFVQIQKTAIDRA